MKLAEITPKKDGRPKHKRRRIYGLNIYDGKRAEIAHLTCLSHPKKVTGSEASGEPERTARLVVVVVVVVVGHKDKSY